MFELNFIKGKGGDLVEGNVWNFGVLKKDISTKEVLVCFSRFLNQERLRLIKKEDQSEEKMR